MGNRFKSAKKDPEVVPPFPHERKDQYLARLDRNTEHDSMTSIKKSPITSEPSEDSINEFSPERPQAIKNSLKLSDKFTLKKSAVFSSTIQINLENQEFSQQLIELIVHEDEFDPFPSNKRALRKLRNSGFWFDLLNKKPADGLKCPNEYHMRLTKLHVLCEVFEFQREFRPDTLDQYKPLLFQQNQSGSSPFHLAFQKLTSCTQISLLIPVLIPLSRKEEQLYTRNRRGENFVHCLLENRSLGIANKAGLLRQVRKKLDPEEYEELILQENLSDEIPFVYANETVGLNPEQEGEKGDLLASLVPKEGFWGFCLKMQQFLKVSNEEIFEFFVLNTKNRKSYEEYYEILYIYLINVIKSLIKSLNVGLLVRYYKENLLNFNLFVSYFFPSKSLHFQERPTHLLELLMGIDAKGDLEYYGLLENVLKEFVSSSKAVFSRIKTSKDLNSLVRYRDFLYHMISNVFANQVLSRLKEGRSTQKEFTIKHINFFKKLIFLLYETLSFGRTEQETRVMIRDIHYNLLNSMLTKTSVNSAQMRLCIGGLADMIKQLQKYFQEKETGLMIIDFLDYSLKNYQKCENLFKVFMKRLFPFVVRSLKCAFLQEFIDDVFCFAHNNKKRNFVFAVQNTPLFTLRLTLDRNGISLEDLGVDENFEAVAVYEAVKFNKPFHLNLLRNVDNFKEKGVKAFKCPISEKLKDKTPFVVRKAGVDFFSGTEDYRFCLKKTKKDLYQISMRHRRFQIVLMLLEWEARNVIEFSLERIPVIQFLLRSGQIGYLRKEVLSKLPLKFKDVWLGSRFPEMKAVWEHIFSMSVDDFKRRFLKSNIKEVLSTNLSDSNLFELLINLKINPGEFSKDDFMIMASQGLIDKQYANGFELLIDKRYFRSAKHLVETYFFVNLKDPKNEHFMKIFNSRMKASGLNLFETLIMNNEFRFFFDFSKKIHWEKIDLARLDPNDPDGKYNPVFSNQIQRFFLFCSILDVADPQTVKSLYCLCMKIPNRSIILPVIFGFLLMNSRWGTLINQKEKQRVLGLFNNNKMTQYVLETVLMSKIPCIKKPFGMKYVLNDAKVLFEKSLCSFRYVIMRVLDTIIESVDNPKLQIDEKLSLKAIMDNSKILRSEKDSVQADSYWLMLPEKFDQAGYNVIEQMILLIDVNYLENAYGYFNVNLMGDFLESGCLFNLEIVGKDYKKSKEIIFQDHTEELSDPLVSIKCEFKPLPDPLKAFSTLQPCIAEYKLW